MSRTPSHRGRSGLAVFGGKMLWQLVGVAAGVIGYAAEAGGFELEMRRAATRRGLLPLGVGDRSYGGTETDRRANDRV